MFFSLRANVVSRIAQAKKAEQLETQKRIEDEKRRIEEKMNKLEKEKNFILEHLNKIIENHLAKCEPLKRFIIFINDEYNAVFCYNYYTFKEIATYLGFEVTQESSFHYRELTIPEFNPKSGKEMTTAQRLLKEFNDKLNEKMNELRSRTLDDCKNIKKMIRSGDYSVIDTSKNMISLTYDFGRDLTNYELDIIDTFFKRKKLRLDKDAYKHFRLSNCYFTLL